MIERIVIIGLDGVPFELLRDLSERGIMPNTKEIITRGVLTKMESSIPEVSSVAWSSIITGCNPGSHGIFGFTELAPNSYRLRFPNFNDLQVPPFWELLEGLSIIINVPATYPVRPLSGVHISGFVSIELEKSVYPQSLLPKLKELDYRLDVDSEKAHKSLDLFLQDLTDTLIARVKLYRYLWRYTDWKIFMFVFTGTDRLMHFLWSAYEDESHPYHKSFLEYFRNVDETIGEIATRIDDNDLLVLISDHGFEKLDKEVYVNYFLERKGFLKLKDSCEQGIIPVDTSTKAFALDPARVYVNLKDKYPCGSVDTQDKEKILRDLEELFNTWEIEDKKVIKCIHRKEQVYAGPFMDRAPDLVLESNPGFNLRGKMNTLTLFDRGNFTGKHARNNAFLLVSNKENHLNNIPIVSDVKNIILSNF